MNEPAFSWPTRTGEVLSWPLEIGRWYGPHEVPNAIYHRLPGISSTQVKRALISVEHLLTPEAMDSRALIIGSATHALALEGRDAFVSEFVVLPSEFQKVTGKGVKNWRLANGHHNRTPLTAKEWVRVLGMTQAVHRHPIASEILKRSSVEQSLWYEDEETGVLCKLRMDLGEADCIWDLKSTARPAGEFQWSIAKYDYDVSAAHYWKGAEPFLQPWMYEGSPFGWIVVESKPPHGIIIYQMDAETMEMGLEARGVGLRRIAQYQKDHKRRAYRAKFRTIGLPAWKQKQRREQWEQK